MTNAVYPKYKQAAISGGANHDLSAGTVKAALVDTGTYTYSATHEFLSDLSGIIGTDQTLTTKTFTDGALNADDPTWPSVTGATIEAFVIYIDTGVAGTSRLYSYMDSGQTGLPVTPNGGDIKLAVNASGIVAL